MNIVFVNYFDFTSNSAIHIFNLGNRLVELGHGCVVGVPSGAESVHALGEPRFAVSSFDDLDRASVFPNAEGPTLVHAWTPRENVRLRTESLTAKFGVPHVVHLEDNEDAIVGDLLGADAREAARSDGSSPSSWPPGLAHPVRSREFLASAVGVTTVIGTLSEFVSNGVPTRVISPAFEEDLFWPRPEDPALRAELGIADTERVVVYPGNVHASNEHEVRSLYLAVGLLNRRGYPVKLVRLGRSFVDFLGDDLRSLQSYAIDVPFIPRDEVPRYLALSDVFVQPGRPGAFNDYRMPAKLPEFFAMGRPVVLPATNLGLEVEDGVDAIVMRAGNAIEIADAVESVLADDARRLSLGRAAREFAEARFSWGRSSLQLADFYLRVLAEQAEPAGTAANDDLPARYSDLEVAPVGYATVRDFVDSLDHLPDLSRLNGDMKDVQRPWTLKTIVSKVAPGSQILEIGAGQPHVADRLARLGYGVWVVDPYDGRDGGPSDFETIRARFPRIHYVRGEFPAALPDSLAGAFDCIYSISVLEHVPAQRIDEFCASLTRFVTAGGVNVHAVDHVLRGDGAADHTERLRRVVARLGLDVHELDAVLDSAAEDVETYFLSAEAHNRWRGSVAYERFPMRRCISVQLCSTGAGARTSASA